MRLTYVSTKRIYAIQRGLLAYYVFKEVEMNFELRGDIMHLIGNKICIDIMGNFLNFIYNECIENEIE